MNYTGKLCDGCRQPLENGDDIVVCPICGTPQHRSCYEKNNKCVNEYLHSTDFTWTDPEEEQRKKEEELKAQQAEQQPQPSDQPVFAPATPQSMESVFLRGVLYDPKDDIGGATVGEAADFVQNSAPRYIRKFMKQKKSGRKLSWNWAAFFFAPYWFFYRKLYKAGAVFLALSVALSLATVSLTENLYGVYEKMVTVQEELSELVKGKEDLNDEDTQKFDKLYAESAKLAKAAIPSLAIILLIQKVIPNTIAALLADFLLKKRMLRVISFSRGTSSEPDAVKYTIMRNGGVSVLMPIIAIMIDNYLPSLLLSIAYKL
ncbi:MAG: RING finger protein [Acutalibacteraceae bacterium]|nr:RING finger protein [Acutalibacteraceae bacterium]